MSRVSARARRSRSAASAWLCCSFFMAALQALGLAVGDEGEDRIEPRFRNRWPDVGQVPGMEQGGHEAGVERAGAQQRFGDAGSMVEAVFPNEPVRVVQLRCQRPPFFGDVVFGEAPVRMAARRPVAPALLTRLRSDLVQE